jgi:hypothetical protein
LKNSDWEQFQSLSSDIILPRIEINTEKESDKRARDFTTPIASAYRLWTGKGTLSGANNIELPELDRLLKHKQRIRKL